MEMRYPDLRFWVDEYYAIQKHRIEVGNHLSANVRSEEVPDPKIVWLMEQMQNLEASTFATIKETVKSVPVYQEWLKGVKGIGPCFGAGLIAYIQTPERFHTISSLWTYSGYGINGDGTIQRRKKGEKANWNPQLKTLVWKIGNSFIKTKGAYRDLYETVRAEYDAKWPEESDGHRLNAARRKMVKIFMSHLWLVWRELEGLPVSQPYVLSHLGSLGHTHPIPIPYWRE